MSDSDKTNELDNYGVWVKKPPHTVSSETDDTSGSGDFANIDVADTPVFDSGETALSADELANLTGGSSSGADAGSSGEEEISLDEFIDGGVFEGDDTAPAASAESSSASPSPAAADDFSEPTESNDITISDSPSIADPSSFSDDGPIDIDLSFDDSDSAPSAGGSSSVSSAPVAEVPGSEEVDLSDFGVDFGYGSSSVSSESAASDDDTEEVDLSDFGVDFSDNTDTSVPDDSEPKIDEPVINDDGTEEISLDSFGFDINAEEGASSSDTSEAAADEAPADEESVPPLSDESPSEKSGSDTMTVEADDDVGDISIEADSSSSSDNQQEAAHDFSAPDDDDFDLDSIMDSIEDENGNTSSLNDTEDEDADATAAENITVVDMEEPVFEETAVDIPENAEGATETSENPFELPPDDAFITPSMEEPATADAPSSEEIPPESSSDEAAEPSGSEEISLDEPADANEPAIDEEAETAAPDAQEDAPTAVPEKDEEISAVTNNLLSQIAAELSSLRGEISTLKSEFAELKNKDSISAQSPSDSEEKIAPEEESFLNQEATESESSGGFFGEDDEDDTIALSIDEMDDILNSVEMVEEQPAAEEPVKEESDEGAGLPDFSNDNIDEPVLDDINTNIAEDELPDEILVPKADNDILAESGEENPVSEESDAVAPADDNADSDSLAIDEPFVFDDAEQETADAEENEPLASDEASAADATLSADELANIAADSSPSEEVSGTEDEGSDSLLTDILDDVSSEEEESDSGVSITAGELDNLLTSEAANPAPAEEEEEAAAPVQSTIPNNLQKEIKSVLSYMDQLLENLPEEKIAEFAQSEQFETYKKLFKELGLN